MSLGRRLSPQILRCMLEIVRPTEIAPIIFVGAKGQDFLALPSESQVGSDDRKHVLLCHHGQQSRRNYVYTAKRTCLRLRAWSSPLRLAVVDGSPATQLELFVEK